MDLLKRLHFFCVMMYNDTKMFGCKMFALKLFRWIWKTDLQQKHQKTNLSKGFFLDTSKVLVLDLF